MLGEIGVVVLDEGGSAGEPCDGWPNVIDLVYCSSEEQWSRLEAQASGGTAVALLQNLELEGYGRALALGAHGVVHVDTPSVVIASIVEAALRSEIVLPRFVAQAFAAEWYGHTPPTDLTEQERNLLRLIRDGSRVPEIAESFSYSERTIRRQLQSLYLKLGVKHRSEAMGVAARMNLGSPE